MKENSMNYPNFTGCREHHNYTSFIWNENFSARGWIIYNEVLRKGGPMEMLKQADACQGFRLLSTNSGEGHTLGNNIKFYL